MKTIAQALASARLRIEAVEAKLLLRHVLACSAATLAAHPERELLETQSSWYGSLVERRAAGEPVAYLIGRREFYGREFAVSPAVLIPRPETELLVDLACAKLSRGGTGRVLDLGTGSGCVAISLALEQGFRATAVEVTAVDFSADALAVARENAVRLGARVRLIESDWFAAVEGEFDLIVGNPPYIAEGDAHLSQGDLRFEPSTALACGTDGLAAIRQILADAPRHLAPGGCLLLEHGYDQAAALRTLLADAGFDALEQHADLAGIVRVSGGVWSGR